MSSHSGTIGRTKGRSLGHHMRRQRSVEWQHDGYSSSEDDDRGHGAINPTFDTQLLAQLIAQSQELSNKCKSLIRYNCRQSNVVEAYNLHIKSSELNVS